MKSFSSILFFSLFFVFLLSGCMRLTLSLYPSLFPNFVASIFEECDSRLAGNSIPASLKLMEGLLKSNPNNKQILTTLSMGFTGYSMFFVEGDDPRRASELYIRARDYGLRALGQKGHDFVHLNPEDLQSALKGMGEKHLDALLWTTVSWAAWINLNLDKPDALAQISLSQTSLERILQINADYFHGLPYILMGVSLAGRPKMFGGDIVQARIFFEKALKVNQRKFFLAQYFLARYYAVRAQDKALFLNLTNEIINGNAHELKEVCLINRISQRNAIALKARADEFFF